MNPKKKAVQSPLGSVFNPQVVGADYRVRFEYEPGNSFEVTLAQNGTLEIRMSGSHSDMMATHHHVSNGSLDGLHEVEARLTDEQWRRYRVEFRKVVEDKSGRHSKDRWVRDALHASSEQKLLALAEVLAASPR